VVGISILQRLNKSSMLKKVSPMNLVVALSAVQLRKHKPEIMAVADTLVNNAKCFLQFALLAGKKLLFLSNLLATNLFIAVSATNHVHVATGKPLIVETFLCFKAWEGFLFLPFPFKSLLTESMLWLG
jgi:hypothetical protein